MRTLVYLYILFFVLFGVIVSCEKDELCNTCQESPNAEKPNQAPNVAAGPDLVVTLPTNYVELDGTSSYDPDGQINSWHWNKISGPNSFYINSPFAAQTIVGELVEGIYEFELKVTDNAGLFGTDKVIVTVIPDPNPATIYVAGSENDGLNTKAKYWKNGTPVNLTDGSSYAEARAIAISDSDVYVAGGEANIAKYWVNGTPINLTDGSRFAWSNAITINNSDVYVAGYERDGNQYTYEDCYGAILYDNYSVAKYWVNGTSINITDGSNDASATDIAVSGSDVYVAGWEYIGNVYVAKYWKNGTPVTLTNNGFANAISVVGNDVYVAGWENTGNGSIAKYWVNGTPFNLTNGGNYAEATAIVVSGTDVYVAGREANNAKYWKNGIPINLTGAGSANAITISGNDVYVAGIEYNTGSNTQKARYWVNGISIYLTNGSSYGNATGIVVLQ